MKNSFSRMFQSMVEWFRSARPELVERARRVRKEQAISPAEFQKMLAQTLADPDFKLMLLKSMAGTAWPIQGGMACSYSATTISHGAFGSDCSETGDYSFPGKVGIGTTSPVGVLSIEHAGSKGLYINETNSGFAGENIFQIDSAATAANAGLVSVNSGGNSRFYVRADGNVGIGTAAPGTPLQVVGTGYLLTLGQSSSSTGKQLLLGINTTGNGYGIIQSLFQGTAYTTLALNPDGGNVGIGTTSPGEKLEVNGNILSKGLNQIVFLKPTGSNDHTQIQSAIDGLPKGGIIMLEPAFDGSGNPIAYDIRSKLTIDHTGVKIRGYGGTDPGNGSPLVSLKWNSSATANETILELKAAGTNTQIQDLEISDLTIDGNNRAGIGLVLDRILNSYFLNVRVQNVTGSPGIGIKLTTTASGSDGDNKGTSWNQFENCSIFECTTGLQLTSETTSVSGHRAGANSCHNAFFGLNIQGASHTLFGIDLVACDNNSFYRTLTPGDKDLGVGVQINGGGNPHDPILHAYSNYFYHLQAGGKANGVIVINADLAENNPPARNMIFGYDLANSENPPVAKKTSGSDANVTDFLFWADSQGICNATRIGIGVTSPGAMLEIGGTAGTDGIKFPDASVQTTAFLGAITSLNGLTGPTQTFAVGTSSPIGWSSSGTVHTLNIPDASASARGVVTTGAQTLAGLKTFQDGVDGSGSGAGVMIRSFSNNTRPTLRSGEVAFWYRPSDGYIGLLFKDPGSGNYFWWASNDGGGGAVKLFVNP